MTTRADPARSARITLVTCLCLVGCAGVWQPLSPEVLASGAPQSYDRALVVTRDGYERQLTTVVVARDSLSGTRVDSTELHISVALADVVRLEVPEAGAPSALAAAGGFARDVLVEVGKFTGSFVKCIFGGRC